MIEAPAEIGLSCSIGGFVSIGAGVAMGRDCPIGVHASLSHAVLGSHGYTYAGAGSAILEDFVKVGRQAAMAGHLRIGQGSQIGAQPEAMSDVPAGSVLLGRPAPPRKDFFRQVATLKRMTRRH